MAATKRVKAEQQPELTLNDLMDVEDVAAAKGVSIRRVRQWLDAGRIPARKMKDRYWVIDGRAVAAFQPRQSGYHGHTAAADG